MEKTIVRQNLMTQKGYAPYCGGCNMMSRAPFNGEQFACRSCGWVSSLEPEFIERYKRRWQGEDNAEGQQA